MIKWLKNYYRVIGKSHKESQNAKGYEFAAAHLLRSNGFGDPRDFIDGYQTDDNPFDQGVRSAVNDFMRILREEAESPKRVERLIKYY